MREDWTAISTMIEEMRRLGFFMAVWSPGQVTNGRTFFNYPRWRVHFQRGAMQVAPTIDAEGVGEGDTFTGAVAEAKAAALVSLMDFEQANINTDRTD